MALKEVSSLTDPNDALPARVALWGRQSDGTLTPILVASDGSVILGTGAASANKTEDTQHTTGDVGAAIMAVQTASPADAASANDYAMLQMSLGRLWVAEKVPVTVSATVTRPADTTTYAANEAWADSDSAPTVGGNTFTSAARKSGGSGIIRDAIITSSADPALTLQGELWIFDAAVTAVNDNAAFALSDADVLKLVAVIPFTLVTTVAGSGTNSVAHVVGIDAMFTCVGTANLRYLVKVKNAYIPISAEVLQVRLKIEQLD